ncbi:MAG: DMT family transporter [Bdellovibrionales bacterium]
MQIAILYAIGSSVCFALASIAFTSISKSLSVAWTNYFKASIASVGFLLLAYFSNSLYLPEWDSIGFLALSGIIGLCIGDMFLLKAFTLLGPGRTLIVFSFHPVFTGIGGYFLFEQNVYWNQFIAIACMVGCLIFLGRENIDKRKSWAFGPLSIAIFAIVLDASGVILTRSAFEADPQLDSSLANFIRAIFCCMAFSIYSIKRPIRLIDSFQSLPNNKKLLIFGGSLIGTFFSLYLYLSAVKIGHIATVSAISATAPIWAGIFEFIFFKQKPTRFFLLAVVFFLIGMIFLNLELFKSILF